MFKLIRRPNKQLAITVYPAVGYPAVDTRGEFWRVRVRGIAWQTPVTLNRGQQWMIRMLGNVMRATPEELRSERFEERIHPFMAGAFKKLPLAIRIFGHTYPLLKKTQQNGRFEESVLIPSSVIASAKLNSKSKASSPGADAVPFDIISMNDKVTVAKGTLFLIPRYGVSVISDIDDTIKDSQVGNRRELLLNTFLREFRSVEGMADVYQQWAGQGAAFHYVSSSPWQLFDSLKAINSKLGFPCGTMHLRHFSFRDQILQRFMVGRHVKVREIFKLVEEMPDREFILIGDSGEKDPRLYRKICQRYPDKVRGVFIRSVAHRPFHDAHTLKLAKSLPRGVVAGFHSADELLESVGQLIEH